MVTHMRATLIVLLVTMSMLPLGYMVYPPATAGNITVQVTWFGNDQEEVIVDFPSAGIDDSNSLSLQTGLYIDQVKMKVSTVDQGPGMKNYPSNVTIDFGGDNMLEYQWRGPGYGALGHQTTFTNGRPYMNATLGTYGPYNDTVAFRLPKTAHVRSATMNLSTGERVGTPGKVLVLNGASNYYGWDTDPVNKLAAFTSDFSVVDRFDAYSSTPVWEEISDYYAILTYTDLIYGYGYQDGGAVGDLLADYVDAGGCVVATIGALYGYSPYMLSGRWTSGGYNVFSSGSSLTTSS